MANIFVSYNKGDTAVARRVAAQLTAGGFAVWWEDGLTPHEAWDATYEPSFDASRRLPAFAALAERTGLLGIWRIAGNAPDFCKAAAAPPVCAMVAR